MKAKAGDVIVHKGKVVEVVEGKPGRYGYSWPSGGSAWPLNIADPSLTPATAKQIAMFHAERKRIKKERARWDAQNDALLSLCGLSKSDFSRFREVWREDTVLYVYTRENGMNTRSVGAIRNACYVSSRADDGDSTYELYEFQIPQKETDDA